MPSPAETIQQRKARHLEICVNPAQYPIERNSNGFEHWALAHRAMPEVSWEELDTTSTFLGYRCRYPLFISCMTGGSADPGSSSDSMALNRELAIAAETFGIPVGTGSIRVLLRHSELLDEFRLKQWAPSVPLLANIGAVVIRDTADERVHELVKQMEADALVIHLNPGQELFQANGDRDFRGIKAALQRFIHTAPYPVLVKETGFGLAPEETAFLLEAGAAYVDIAGSGGANWMLVEAHRDESLELASEFEQWGYRTAEALWQARGYPERILASGGLRSGSDCAKALAMGAVLCGMATPLVRALHQGGAAGLQAYIAKTLHSLKLNMLLSGSRKLADLRRPGVLRAAPTSCCD